MKFFLLHTYTIQNLPVTISNNNSMVVGIREK